MRWEAFSMTCTNYGARPPHYTIISSSPADGSPDGRIQFEGADTGGLALRTDSGGDTYVQCAQYSVSSALAQREAAKPALLSSCQPML